MNPATTRHLGKTPVFQPGDDQLDQRPGFHCHPRRDLLSITSSGSSPLRGTRGGGDMEGGRSLWLVGAGGGGAWDVEYPCGSLRWGWSCWLNSACLARLPHPS